MWNGGNKEKVSESWCVKYYRLEKSRFTENENCWGENELMNLKYSVQSVISSKAFLSEAALNQPTKYNKNKFKV